MNDIILKCWNGILGCCSFEVYYKHLTNNADEAALYYKDIWDYVWLETVDGKIIKKY